MNRSHKIIFYKKLPSDLKVQFEQLMHQSFTWHQSGEEKQVEHDKFCSKRNQVGFVLAFNTNQLIGAVIILKRQIKFNDANLVLGGIGGVSVRREYRRQGLATAMLQTAIEMLKQEKCDLAYLCR